MQVCDWHLGCRNQKELILFQSVTHLVLEFRQLGCTNHRLASNQVRGAHLDVTVLGRMQIEKKLKQTTLEPSAQVGETNETAATDFRGSFEIDQFQCGRQLNMTERRKTETRFFAPFANERVIVGALADRRLEMR